MTELKTPAAKFEVQMERVVSFSSQEHQFFIDVKMDLLRRLVNERLGSMATARVLDLGCGVGTSHASLAPAVSSLHGADVGLEYVQFAHRSHPTVSHVVFDGLRLPYDAEAFDVVFAVCVFHHVAPSEWSALVAEAQRVIRPGGLLIIAEHNPLNPLTRLTVMRCEFDVGVKLLSRRTTEALLRDASFVGVESHFTLLFPWRKSTFRSIEDLFHRYPIGAQYLTIGLKPLSKD